jgi:hypothetical protein
MNMDTPVQLEQAFEILLLGGILGLFGQGSRAALGLKTLSDFANAPNPSQSDVFNAARFTISLSIGFLAGIAAALSYMFAGGDVVNITGKSLLAFAAAGYIGTDAIESFFVKYFDKSSANPVSKPQSDGLSMETLASSLEAFSSVQARLSAFSNNRITSTPTLTYQVLMNFITTTLYPPPNKATWKPSDPLAAGSPADNYKRIGEIVTFFVNKGLSNQFQMSDFEFPASTTYAELAANLGALFVRHGGKYVSSRSA